MVRDLSLSNSLSRPESQADKSLLLARNSAGPTGPRLDLYITGRRIIDEGLGRVAGSVIAAWSLR